MGFYEGYNSGTSAIDWNRVEADRQQRIAADLWNQAMKFERLYPATKLSPPEKAIDIRAKLLLLCEEA